MWMTLYITEVLIVYIIQNQNPEQQRLCDSFRQHCICSVFGFKVECAFKRVRPHFRTRKLENLRSNPNFATQKLKQDIFPLWVSKVLFIRVKKLPYV